MEIPVSGVILAPWCFLLAVVVCGGVPLPPQERGTRAPANVTITRVRTSRIEKNILLAHSAAKHNEHL